MGTASGFTGPSRERGAWRRRIVPTLAFVATLNVCAWLMLFGVAGRDVTLLGIGAMAYFFGLRHAFDADHIAAIDNVTRKLRQDGKRPVATGLFFSLGHSTVVIALSLVLALAARESQSLDALRDLGGLFGTVLSALFLTLIGLVNLRILVRLVRALKRSREGDIDVTASNASLVAGGLMSRLFGRIYRGIHASWQMYPLGFLFGLGFDTATEIAILSLSAGLAQHGSMDLVAVMVFPLLFTAGMSLMDTLDGLVMLRVYDWAMADALRKLFFNTTITGFSVLVALLVGGVEWLQLMANQLGWQTGIWGLMENLDFATVGFMVTGLTLFSWLVAAMYYRHALRPLENRAPG